MGCNVKKIVNTGFFIQIASAARGSVKSQLFFSAALLEENVIAVIDKIFPERSFEALLKDLECTLLLLFFQNETRQ